MSDAYIVLAPRFSSLVGGGDYPTLPVDTRSHIRARVSVWRGRIVNREGGGGEAVGFTFEESSDLSVWVECQGISPAFDPGEDVEGLAEFTLTMKFVRMRVSLAPDAAQVSYYAFGFFMLPS